MHDVTGRGTRCINEGDQLALGNAASAVGGRGHMVDMVGTTYRCIGVVSG